MLTTLQQAAILNNTLGNLNEKDGINCTICGNGGGGSKRQEVKTLLRRLKRDNPNIEKSIFNSIHNVCLDTFPAYKVNGVFRSPYAQSDENGSASG